MSQDNPRPADGPRQDRGIVTEVVVPVAVTTASNVLTIGVAGLIKKKDK